jgi:hypothetical protein
MQQDKFVIKYQSIPDVERASGRMMTLYLEKEEVAWMPFFDILSREDGQFQVYSYQTAYGPALLRV